MRRSTYLERNLEPTRATRTSRARRDPRFVDMSTPRVQDGIGGYARHAFGTAFCR